MNNNGLDYVIDIKQVSTIKELFVMSNIKLSGEADRVRESWLRSLWCNLRCAGPHET